MLKKLVYLLIALTVFMSCSTDNLEPEANAESIQKTSFIYKGKIYVQEVDISDSKNPVLLNTEDNKALAKIAENESLITYVDGSDVIQLFDSESEFRKATALYVKPTVKSSTSNKSYFGNLQPVQWKFDYEEDYVCTASNRTFYSNSSSLENATYISRDEWGDDKGSSGWYSDGDISRYWNGYSFGVVKSCTGTTTPPDPDPAPVCTVEESGPVASPYGPGSTKYFRLYTSYYLNINGFNYLGYPPNYGFKEIPNLGEINRASDCKGMNDEVRSIEVSNMVLECFEDVNYGGRRIVFNARNNGYTIPQYGVEIGYIAISHLGDIGWNTKISSVIGYN